MASSSVLDKMSKGIMDTKMNRQVKLTAVPGETPAPVAFPPPVVVSIPNHPVVGSLAEDPDIILQRLAAARTEVEAILASITRLETAWGKPDEALAAMKAIDLTNLSKLEERRADDRAKAAAGDAKAAERVETEVPIEKIEAKIEARIDKKQAALDAMNSIDADVATSPTGGETFTERMARLSAEAQAATFTQPAVDTVTPGAAEVSVAAGGWVCPEHGQAIDTTSPKGRQYRKCPVCGEFERL